MLKAMQVDYCSAVVMLVTLWLSVVLTVLQKKLGLGEQNPPSWLERDRARMGTKAGHCLVKHGACCYVIIWENPAAA